MRLFWKILLGYLMAWVLLTLALFGSLALVQSVRWIPAQAISRNLPSSGLVTHTALNLRVGGVPVVRSMVESWPRGKPPFVVDEAGREVLLGREVDLETLAVARSLADREPDPGPVKSVTGPDGRTYVVFYPQGEGPADRIPLRWFFEWPWLVGAVLAAAGLLLASSLAGGLTRPIDSLKAAFDALAEGRLGTRVDPRVVARRDELGDLGRHFDAMAGRLEHLVDAQRRLLHDVSHELRSPLARLDVALDLARQRPERTAEALERIEKESGRLDRLIGQVLTLARVESGAAGESVGDFVDLVELLRVVEEDASFEAGAGGVEIVRDTGDLDELVISGNGDLIHRAVENVVRNALQHAPGSSRIELALEDGGGDRVQIHVRDEGEKVSAEDLKDLFEPFKRGRGSTGFGFGLAIARRAVEVHGGTIRARARRRGGLEVVLELPRGTSGAPEGG